MQNKCTSCNRSIMNDKQATSFTCVCSKETIIRCGQCRKNAVPYKCKCGFEGP